MLDAFRSFIWFALISPRGMTLDNLLLPRSSSFFVIINYLGVSGFSCRIFSIFESSQLNEFSTDLQDSSLQNYFKILGTGLPYHEPIHLIVIFQY